MTAMRRTRQAELKEELFSACFAGDVDRVCRAIAAGVDPKKAINKDGFFRGETPLHTACMYVIDITRPCLIPKFQLGSWLH